MSLVLLLAGNVNAETTTSPVGSAAEATTSPGVTTGPLQNLTSTATAHALSAEGETSASMTETSATAAGKDLATTAPVSSGSPRDTSTYLAPVENVKPLKLGSEWLQRFEATGVSPDTFWERKATPQTEQDHRDLMAHRHFFMGWYYLELSQPGRAVEEYKKALEFDPENSHILLDAARAHLAVHESAEADKLITKVLEKETTNVEAMWLRAETDLASAAAARGTEQDQLVKKAGIVLEKAHEIQPNNMKVLRSLGRVYNQQQEIEKVISVFKDIVAVNPRDTYSLEFLAQILARIGRPKEALEYFKKVIEQKRGYLIGYVNAAQIYENLKQYEQALDMYRQAILVNPHNSDLLRLYEDLIAKIHGINDTDGILGEYKSFVSEYPGNTEVRRIYAERLQSERKSDEAAKQYEKILETDPENTDACVSLAKLYADKEDYAKAEEYFRKAIEIDPDKVELYDAIASTLLAQEKPDEAKELYQKAIEASPSSEKLYISLAALLENDGETTQAIKVMQQAVEKAGEKPELLAVLGKFYRTTGDKSKAVTTLRKAYDRASDNLPLYGELMSAYLEDGNTTAAEEITSRTAESAKPGKDVVLSVAAEFNINAGRYDRAVALYVEALNAKPTEIGYLARLVAVLNRQKLYDRALQYIDEFGAKAKDEDKVEAVRAQVYSAAGEHDKAIATYRRLLSKKPTDLVRYQDLIDALNDAKRYDESLKVINQAQTKLGKTDPDTVLMMTGMVYYKQKKYKQAEKAFRDLIKRTGGKSDDSYYYLGSVFLEQERFEDAEREFRKAIEVNPLSANALNALGYMYADRGIKLEEAKKLIQEALDINPTAPHILDSMGWVLFKLGELEAAEDYVERAARQFDDAVLYSHLGDIYAKQGKTDLARQTYQHSLELDPTDKTVKEKIRKLSGDDKE